jgi:hypothetical protein
MILMEILAELLDTATNDAHKPEGHQNIPVTKNNTVHAVNELKYKYLSLYQQTFQNSAIYKVYTL